MKAALLDLVLNLAKVLGVLVAIYALLIAYVGLWKEPRARAAAKDFCASVKVGDSADGLEKRALDAGAASAFAKWVSLSDKYRTTDERQMLVIFTGLPPFSRHICALKANAHAIVDARYEYLD